LAENDSALDQSCTKCLASPDIRDNFGRAAAFGKVGEQWAMSAAGRSTTFVVRPEVDELRGAQARFLDRRQDLTPSPGLGFGRGGPGAAEKVLTNSTFFVGGLRVDYDTREVLSNELLTTGQIYFTEPARASATERT
jgi:hypothetical protein